MAKTKKQLQIKVRIPHLVVDARHADPKILEELAPGLEELEARVHILGEGANRIPHPFSIEEAMEEADMWVVLGEKLPKELPMLLEKGIVPILLQGSHKYAANYNAVREEGNSIIFPKLSAWHVYGALVRAIENFAFPYDWQNLQDRSKELI